MKSLIYIAHPISSNLIYNLQKIADIYRALSLEGSVIPFAPYMATIDALDDSSSDERNIGMSHNRALFERKVFDELWVYGLSKAVELEIKWAEEFDIPVRYMGEVEI